MSLTEFWGSRRFEPDPFQRQAAEALEAGKSDVLTAPTGSGKTAVAEAAIHLARSVGRRTLYTTPIKALSNQKYSEFCAELGTDNVGLLTGDNSINGDAPVVVMTTEVLRNMIYMSPSSLENVQFVVLDEIHYLQDAARGSVWEEVIIHSPQRIQILGLSATVANSSEFRAWIQERRGPTSLVEHRERPVPLESEYMMRDRWSEELVRLPTLKTEHGRRRPNPAVESKLQKSKGRYATPRRTETIEELSAAGILPAIYFIFSRAGCEAAAEATSADLTLTDRDEREEIGMVVEAQVRHVETEDLAALGYSRWLSQLESGIASHHAGLVPVFKQTVEELFGRGLIKVVFATETLALGINMPARTVVLESLSKFTGEDHELLKPGDYTQLTGRAGRRGIDTRGYGVVLHSRFVPFRAVAEMASQGSHALLSSFRPTYNMTANLMSRYAQEDAERLLAASFAAFQRRKEEREVRTRVARFGEQIERLRSEVECEFGDAWSYLEWVESSTRGKRGRRVGEVISTGDVVEIQLDGRRIRAVVVERRTSRRSLRVVVIDKRGRLLTWGEAELGDGMSRLGSIDLPTPYRPADSGFRRTAQARLREFRAANLRSAGRGSHPVVACPDAAAHLKAARSIRRTESRLKSAESELERTSTGLVQELHRHVRVLQQWGYASGWELTEKGEQLRLITTELDLLVTESVRRGLLNDLTPEEFASLLSGWVHEPRREAPVMTMTMTDTLERRWMEVLLLVDELSGLESREGLVGSRLPDGGVAEAVYRWASGSDLEAILEDLEISPGDFVRVLRQLIDLARQVRDGFPHLYSVASSALKKVDRGVVAAGGIV